MRKAECPPTAAGGAGQLLDIDLKISSPLTDTQPRYSSLAGYNGRIKEYPDRYEITAFTRPVFNALPKARKEQHKQLPLLAADEGDKPREERSDNTRRAVQALYDIVACNEWEYFLTLTLSPDEIDRADIAALTERARVWFGNRVQRHGLRYVCVPEWHANHEGIHLHALAAGGNLQLVYSGHKRKGRRVYNLPEWRLGFSTAQRCYDNGAALAHYLTKYLTKGGGEKIAGKRYWHGGELVRSPPTYYATLDLSQLPEGREYDIPAASMRVRYCTIPKGAEYEKVTTEAQR